MVISAITMMNHHRPFNPGNRNQFQANVGVGTLKQPPSWSYEDAVNYSLRSWISDIVLWSSATDLETERQGPAVALQIAGCARDLIREIPSQVLRDGQWEQGNHVPGLMVLCGTLAAHYAPLESELQTRAMAELMGFCRLNGESIDSCLTRFDVLRNRANQRGGIVMNVTSLAWLLLNGLRLRPEQWDRVLIAEDGALPNDDQGLQRLLDRLRRFGRMQEGYFNPPHRQGAMGEMGSQHFYYPTFDQTHASDQPYPASTFGNEHAHVSYYGNRSSASNQQQPWSLDMPSPSDFPFEGNSSFPTMELDESEEQCTRCGMYYEDQFSSSTESDQGGPDSDAGSLYAFCENDQNMLGNVLYGEYMLAKQRWRRYSGRPPRRYRTGHFNKYHQRNNFQKLQRYGRSYASFLPPNAFAAHRGPGGKSGGKGKSKSKGRQNPRGKDGQLLKCHRCGSTEHLIRRCPVPENASNSSPPNALAMMSGRPNQNLQLYARAGDGSGAVGQSVGIPSGNHPQIKRSLTSIDDDLESLRSVASSRRRVESLASGSGSDKQKIDYGDNPEPPHPAPSTPAPTLQEIQQTRLLKTSSTTETWTAFTTGTASHDVGNEGTIMTADARRSTNVIRGLSLGSTFFGHRTAVPHVANESSDSNKASLLQASDFRQKETFQDTKVQHDPSNQDKSEKEEKAARNAVTLQLSDLLHTMGQGRPSGSSDSNRQSYHPWWEMIEDEGTGPGTGTSISYHALRTVTRDGRIGLLVDPGAHDNLAGESTIRRLEAQLGTRARVKKLDHALNVSGVGKESQQADHALSIEFSVPSGDTSLSCVYTAPVIEGSSLPPLLGLKSLQAKRAIIDTHGRLLILPGEGGIEFRCSPGTQVLNLDMSESGHLILPMDVVAASPAGDLSTINPPTRVDFPVSVRSATSPAPRRHAKRPSPGPYQRDKAFGSMKTGIVDVSSRPPF